MSEKARRRHLRQGRRYRSKARGLAAGAAVLLGACLFALQSAACRKEPPRDIPGTFTFRGATIHPAALFDLYRSKERSLDLAAYKSSLKYGEWDTQPGWFITEYEENLATGNKPFVGYAVYTNLDPFSPEAANLRELYIVSMTFDDGTQNEVDTLMLLEKQGSFLLLLRAWPEGTGCSGAIDGERIEGDNFFYARQLTPLSLLELSEPARSGSLELSPNEDLEAGILHCVGTASYVYNFAEDRETLISVRLDEEKRDTNPARTAGYRFQTCFNALYNSYVEQGRILLSPKDLDDFARAFQEKCLTVS
jgi:hypothetical protein